MSHTISKTNLIKLLKTTLPPLDKWKASLCGINGDGLRHTFEKSDTMFKTVSLLRHWNPVIKRHVLTLQFFSQRGDGPHNRKEFFIELKENDPLLKEFEAHLDNARKQLGEEELNKVLKEFLL